MPHFNERVPDALSWFEDVVAEAIRTAPDGLSVTASYYVTEGGPSKADDASEDSDEKSHKESPVSQHTGRPDIFSIVQGFCGELGTAAVASTYPDDTTIVDVGTNCFSCAACGPESFSADVGKAVSDCELAIFSGQSACSEIYMHHESYACVPLQFCTPLQY